MSAQKKLLALGLAAAVIGIPLALKHRGGDAIQVDQAAAPSAVAPAASSSIAAAATPRPLPKLVDLGTRTCAPCKAMLGVLDELERGYGGQLAVEFINVAEQEEKAAPYAVDVIPTQVFLGPDGKELFRHVGFFSRTAIVQKWGELGFPLKGSAVPVSLPNGPR
jgi:thioredoxin 1